MLTSDDRNAIEGLFRRLEEAERRGGPRDSEAEDLIGRLLRRQPAAPYYLAQTVVVQQEALNEAERRIDELEERLSRGNERRRNPWGDPAPANYQPPPPYGQNYGYGGFGGGGFLAGAAQTALGVAGGVLLGNMIGSVFSAGSAHADEGVSHDTSGGGNDAGQDGGSSDAGGNDAGSADAGGFGDGGGFGGDGGGFDGGGFDTGGGF